jgi:pyruvate dehydrogenase E1 component alpha subunit
VREACIAMPDPQPLTLFDDVYTGPTAQLEAERAGFAAYLDSFLDAESEAALAGEEGR